MRYGNLRPGTPSTFNSSIMKPTEIINALDHNQKSFECLLVGLEPAEYQWKPHPENWSILEVVCHLYDEEREDFRARTRLVLENPNESMPPINPPQWAIDRHYMEQDFDDRMCMFLQERKESIQWLRSLEDANWEQSYNHPKLGMMTAFQFLSNWLAHDYLHIRQILRLKYQRLATLSGQDLSYAGNW